MPARSTPKAIETRGHLLETALALFRKQGFDQTGMREIAQASGLSAGAAYYHFDSKEAMVLAYYDGLQQTSGTRAALLRSSKLDARERLLSFMLESLQQLEPDRKFIMVLVRNGVDPKSPLSPFSAGTKPLRDNAIGQFEMLLEGSGLRLIPELAPHAARLFWLVYMALILHWAFDNSPHQIRTQRVAAAGLEILFGALRLQRLPPVRRLLRRIATLLKEY